MFGNGARRLGAVLAHRMVVDDVVLAVRQPHSAGARRTMSPIWRELVLVVRKIFGAARHLPDVLGVLVNPRHRDHDGLAHPVRQNVKPTNRPSLYLTRGARRPCREAAHRFLSARRVNVPCASSAVSRPARVLNEFSPRRRRRRLQPPARAPRCSPRPAPSPRSSPSQRSEETLALTGAPYLRAAAVRAGARDHDLRQRHERERARQPVAVRQPVPVREHHFECIARITDDIEWKLTYVGGRVGPARPGARLGARGADAGGRLQDCLPGRPP